MRWLSLCLTNCLCSASFNENCSTEVTISLVNYLGCTGLPDHKYLGLLITYLQTLLSHFQFTEPQQATSLYSSPKSTLTSGTIISPDPPFSCTQGLEARLQACILQDVVFRYRDESCQNDFSDKKITIARVIFQPYIYCSLLVWSFNNRKVTVKQFR